MSWPCTASWLVDGRDYRCLRLSGHLGWHYGQTADGDETFMNAAGDIYAPNGREVPS